MVSDCSEANLSLHEVESIFQFCRDIMNSEDLETEMLSIADLRHIAIAKLSNIFGLKNF